MKNTLNKFIKATLLVLAVIAIVAAFLLPTITSKAQPYYGSINTPVVNSSASTNAVVNFPYWPVMASAATTNFTAIDITTVREVSLEFTCQGTNATTTSNVVWTVYGSAKSKFPTNAAGTSLTYDTIGYVTNVLNGTTPVTTLARYTPLGKSATANQSSDVGIAGISTLYIGIVNPGTASGLTNYSVTFKGK
jgi:hypothetical protein